MGNYVLQILDANGCEKEVVFEISALNNVQKLEEVNFVTIYPNPIQDKLYLHFSNKEEKLIHINIIYSDGKIFFEQQFFSRENFEIDTSDFPQGMYFLTLRMDKIPLIYKKILKQ
ncbi:MAG: hypothetical protein ACI9XO_004849 [Paraglaciecola sp.]